MHTRADDIASWLRAQAAAAGARGFVVGLSGTVAAAATARLCEVAMPERVLGVVLPGPGDQPDDDHLRLVADHLRIATIRIDLAPAYERLLGNVRAAIADLPAPHRSASAADAGAIEHGRAAANLESRLRMSALYTVANSLHYLVAGTVNRSELTIGRFTKYGDGAADVLPLGNLLESEVRALGRDLGLPEFILEQPQAQIGAARSDETDLGFTDADLERYLTHGPDGVAPAMALRLERLIRQTDHKRATPPRPDDAGER